MVSRFPLVFKINILVLADRSHSRFCLSDDRDDLLSMLALGTSTLANYQPNLEFANRPLDFISKRGTRTVIAKKHLKCSVAKARLHRRF